MDSRERVIAAIDGGLSCRAAAAHFGVSAASAIRWRQLTVRTGKAVPRRPGEDSRSKRIEAHHDFIRALIAANVDLTLDEVRAALAAQGTSVSVAAVWRFFDRHKITRKKDRARHRPGPSRHSEQAVGLVRGPARPRSRPAGVHRRDLGLDEHGAASWSVPTRRTAPCGRTARPLENHDVRRGVTQHRHGRANGA